MASALDTLLATQQAPDVLGAFNQGTQNRNRNALQAFQLQQAPIVAGRQQQAAQRQAGLQGQQSQLNQQKLTAGEEAAGEKKILQTAALIGSVTDIAEFEQIIINAPFIDDEAKQNALQIGPDAIRRMASQINNRTRGQTAGQREFSQLTEGLPEEERKKAALIKLGLSPRAVGSAIQTISDQDIAEEIGNAEAIIGERKRFGELTGSSRSNAIDKGFDRIVKIDLGLNNIDKAITALQGGAGTGAIERFLPSIKAASVELNNIRAEMALDVVGATTFGALSKGELDLAKDVALPTGLDGPELLDFLGRKKQAQLKLRGYFQSQIDFLDQGGSVAGFLREQERKIGNQQPEQETQTPASVGRFQIEVVQ